MVVLAGGCLGSLVCVSLWCWFLLPSWCFGVVVDVIGSVLGILGVYLASAFFVVVVI